MSSQDINFVYCFDQNYNVQANNSINSILDKTTEKINIYIIHRKPESFAIYLERIKKRKNLKKIDIYEFKDHELLQTFPRVFKTHISEATYYRFFIEQYLPKDINFITYLDSDIICVSSPVEILRNQIKLISESEYLISAKTESFIDENYKNIDNNFRLDLKSKKYFNAGVMVINYRKWLENSTSSKLLEELNRIKDDVYYWDQDVLNSYFDGEYIELSEYLNFNLHLTKNDFFDKRSKNEKNEISLIHYAGSYKPWSVRGIYNPKSKYYQDQHMKLNNNNYHIVNTWRPDALFRFVQGILTFRFIFIKKPIKFVVGVLISLLKSSKK